MKTDRERITELEARIAQLEARLAQLETRQAWPGATPTPYIPWPGVPPVWVGTVSWESGQ